MEAILLFRNDLRIVDNQALDAARKNHSIIHALFVFDSKIHTHKLSAQKTSWINDNLSALQKELNKINIPLNIETGDVVSIIKKKFKSNTISHIYANICIDPATRIVDEFIKKYSQKNSITFSLFHSNTLLPLDKIKNKSGDPYRRYTPFKNAYITTITKSNFYDAILIPNIKTKIEKPKEESGFFSAIKQLDLFIKNSLFDYEKKRNFPAKNGTSKLSIYLAIGVLSPKIILATIFVNHKIEKKIALPFVQEIIWREFCHYTLWHFPEATTKPLQKNFHFPWKENRTLWKKFQEGKTGYPIIDAGIQELYTTGWMHNRVRMIIASFLTKDLQIPWQTGESWMFSYLRDGDIASNVFNWQWVAGCGLDAAPFFRIFNPILQSKKFDPNGYYIKKFLPQLNPLPSRYIHAPWEAPHTILQEANIELGKNYPMPIVNHELQSHLAKKLFLKRI